MATSELEQLILGSTSLNDGTNFTIEDGTFTFTPAQKKPIWATNANADGDALVGKTHYTNAYFEFSQRIESQETMDAALEKLGELMAVYQECENIEGGQAMEWTPHDTESTLTWYITLAEINGMPVTQLGDDAGWLLDKPSPVLKVKLTAEPFGHGEETQVLAPVESEAPVQVAYVKVGGDVPAEARLVLTDKAEQDRRFAEFGQDTVESEEGNPDLELEADEDLVVEGYAGELAELEGSVSSKVVKATLRPTALVLCATGPIAHVGSYRLKLRCQASGEGAWFRASYRVGDGSWTSLPWQSPPAKGKWVEIDLTEVEFEEAEKGEQVGEIRIEGRVEETNCTGYVDLLGLMPTRRYVVLRAPTEVDSPTVLVATDSFNQAGEPSATGQEDEAGNTYAALTNSDADDFKIVSGKLRRTTTSDTGSIGTASYNGRGIGPGVSFTDLACQFDFSTNSATEQVNSGQVLSYVDNTHFILVRANLAEVVVSSPTATLASESISGEAFLEGRLLCVVLGSQLSVYLARSGGELQKYIQIEDAMVGVEGTAFVYDENSAAAACTRQYDNLAMWVPDVPLVCASGQAVEVRSDANEREDPTGKFWTPVPLSRGARLYLDPEGSAGLINRVAVKMRRNDTKLEPDTNPTDKQTLEVLARECFLAPR